MTPSADDISYFWKALLAVPLGPVLSKPYLLQEACLAGPDS